MSGAFVISLDFELHWGIRDQAELNADTSERMRAARGAVRELLRRFDDAGIGATWATVGFLFADRREELAAHTPRVKPAYAAAALDPFRETPGENEAVDPAHYARSLVEAIRTTPRQEIATHTFSHYYCFDDEVGPAAFDADLASAVSIAATLGVELRSIVFPRNQVCPQHLEVLGRHGIRNYRGNPALSASHGGEGPIARGAKRVLRLADAYLPVSGPTCFPWSTIVERSGLRNVRASMFLRAHYPKEPLLGDLHVRRVVGGLRHAAERGEVFHLWWHPHNFAANPGRSFAVLDAVLEEFVKLRDAAGIQSLTMDEAANEAEAA